MQVRSAKAVSVTEQGEEDGWEPVAGWFSEMTPQGDTRLTAAGPVDRLPAIHRALVASLATPVSVLYRQKIDRRDPKPQGAPPRDFVARDVPLERVLSALESAAPLVYGDARCEVWLQDGLGARLVLDEHGIVYGYPDDPSFHDALATVGVEEAQIELISERDYVKHWFHAECDALEDHLIGDLQLTEVPHR